MAMTEACDRLWTAPTIDQESLAHTYTSSRPEWRTKVSGPTVVVEESNGTEQPRPRPTTTRPPLVIPHSVCHSAMDMHTPDRQHLSTLIVHSSNFAMDEDGSSDASAQLVSINIALFFTNVGHSDDDFLEGSRNPNRNVTCEK
jgi:hypothetical protein